MPKLVTQNILEKNTTDVLQIIADNVYSEEEYSEQEIDDMFDATPEKLAYYESLIQDDTVSLNRIFSSKKVSDLIAEGILEANKYTDQASVRNLTTEIVSSTTDVTKENVLYLILSDAGTNTYEQYMLIGGTATALGSTKVDLSNVYNKTEIDTKLDEKANKNEVLSMDNVILNEDDATNSNVFSAEYVKNALASKSDIDQFYTRVDKAKISIDNDLKNGNFLLNGTVEDGFEFVNEICFVFITGNFCYITGLSGSQCGYDKVEGAWTLRSSDYFMPSKDIEKLLEKKFDKSGILSAVSATPSDEKVLSEKAVKTELDKLFQSVSDGKTLVASAITDKGVDTLATDTFQTMADNIGKIQTGVDLTNIYSAIRTHGLTVSGNESEEEIAKIIEGLFTLKTITETSEDIVSFTDLVDDTIHDAEVTESASGIVISSDSELQGTVSGDYIEFEEVDKSKFEADVKFM